MLWSGRVGEAEVLAAEVLRRAHDPAVEGVLRLARGRALFILGRIEQGLGVLDVGDAASLLSPAERAQLLADRSYGYAMSGRFREADALACSAREAAEAAGQDLAWCVATSALSLTAFFRGDLLAAVDLARAAVGRAEMSPSPLARRYPVHYFLAVFLVEADRFAEAEEVVLAGRWMNQEWGTTWVLPMLEWVSATSEFLRGNWDDAVVAAEAGLAMAGEGGTRQGFDCAKGLADLVAAYRSGPAGGHIDADAADAGSQPQVPPSGVLVGLAGVLNGLVVEAQAGPEAALAVLEDAWRRATDVGSIIDHRLLGPELVRLALTTGAAERAPAVAAAVEEVAARMGTDGARGAALRCRGLLKADADALLASAAAYASAGRPLERAFALEEAGAALAAAGRRTEAVAALEEAGGVYEKLGALPALTRVESRVRALGARRGQRARRRRPQQGWESLTPSEQRVVDLVARGLTNVQIAQALFVSRHTVESHVSHVFAKLGLASRSELAAQAVARSSPRVGVP
jgi:DNA-binding CsgD family transcriptional regulator